MRKCQDIPHLFFVAGERSHRFAGPVAASILSLFWLMTFITITGQPAHGQTYQVIHNFTNRGDGAYPSAGLTVGPRGAFYGTAAGGGSGFGTVFEVRGFG